MRNQGFIREGLETAEVRDGHGGVKRGRNRRGHEEGGEGRWRTVELRGDKWVSREWV